MHLLTQSAILRALGWSLFNSLWQMGLLWLFYSLVISVFNEAAARIRHGLALVLLGIGSIWSTGTFIQTYFFADGGDSPISVLSVLLPVQGSTGLLWQTVRSVFGEALTYISLLYLAVLSVLLVRYFHHYRQTRRLSRTGLSPITPAFGSFVTATSRRLGISSSVQVWLSSLVEVPVTLGSFRPVILLPIAMMSQLTPQQVEAILVHELAHIQRKDYLLNLGVTVLEHVFFFNPFVRKLVSDLKKEREHCCDDLVLQFQYDPHSYVSALLSLAAQSQQTQLAVAATGGGDDRLLLQRAKRMLLQKREAGSRAGLRSLVLLLLTTMTLVSPVVFRPLARPAANSGKIVQSPKGIEAPVTFTEVTVNLPGPIPPPTPKPPKRRDVRTAVKTAYGTKVNAIVVKREGIDWLRPEQVVALVTQPQSHRSFSIGSSWSAVTTPEPEDDPDAETAPYVPTSSFSYKYVEEDTLRTVEKQVYVQLQAQHEITAAMDELRLQLLKQLKDQQTQLYIQQASQESQYEQERFNRQLQLQYLKKVQQMQQRLKKTTHRLTIVYM
jgi:beta-lactamase regulating signal transducer with metallopeptidase domain